MLKREIGEGGGEECGEWKEKPKNKSEDEERDRERKEK